MITPKRLDQSARSYHDNTSIELRKTGSIYIHQGNRSEEKQVGLISDADVEIPNDKLAQRPLLHLKRTGSIVYTAQDNKEKTNLKRAGNIIQNNTLKINTMILSPRTNAVKICIFKAYLWSLKTNGT